MSYIRNRLHITVYGILLLIALVVAIPVIGDTFPPPPDTTPEPPKDVVIPKPTGELRTVIIAATGPETKGALIEIAGKQIQLPSDAYIAYDLFDVVCVIGGDPCPETPLYIIARSSSTITVSAPSGIIYKEEISEGDKEPFAFIKDALR